MGTFNTTCALSDDTIKGNTPVVAILLTANYHKRVHCQSWDFWAPIPILFEGLYNEGGGISNVKLFQSQDTLEPIKLKNVEDLFVKNMQNYILGASTLDELLVGRGVSFVQKDPKKEMVNAFLKHTDFLNQVQADFALSTLKTLGFSNVKDAQEFVESEDTFKATSLECVFFKKDMMLKFLSEFEANSTNTDNYAKIIQDKRSKNDTDISEVVSVVTGEGHYAGCNKPKFTLLSSNSKDLSIKSLHESTCLDVALIDEYFNLLGKSWKPSMAQSQNLEDYNVQIAQTMKKSLVDAAYKPKLTNKF